MSNPNLFSRRSFLSHSVKTGAAVALSTLVDIPFVMKRALADGSIGLNGKKVLFIWLRFGNDSLNSVIPVQDSQYFVNRPREGFGNGLFPGWRGRFSSSGLRTEHLFL
jgi:uncharacterized protein (DUF1501 family)